MEFIRLEGEIENKSKLALLIMKLDGKTIKLSGFPESLKVRAAETKVTFPVRHDWDSYFRDARNMNELKPGERPDTIHLQDLPTRWFAKRSDKTKSPDQKLKPSEEVVRQVFETFGEVRCIDVPILDPYRKEIMGSMAKPGTIQTFNYGQDINFEAYVQFKEYISFVKAMDALRGMKLLFKEEDDKALTANIKVSGELWSSRVTIAIRVFIIIIIVKTYQAPHPKMNLKHFTMATYNILVITITR